MSARFGMLIDGVPASGVGPAAAVSSIERSDREVATATAVSEPTSVELSAPSCDRTINRPGVSAAGRPGEDPPPGLSPEPVVIRPTKSMVGAGPGQVKPRGLTHPANDAHIDGQR